MTITGCAPLLFHYLYLLGGRLIEADTRRGHLLPLDNNTETGCVKEREDEECFKAGKFPCLTQALWATPCAWWKNCLS